MLRILRAGNVKVEKHVLGILKEIGSSLEEEYEDVKMEFEVHKKGDDDEEEKPTKKKGKKESKKKEIEKSEVDVTVARDTRALVEKVIAARELNRDNVKTRVVIDGGQGSLKVVASVFDGEQDPEVSDQGGPGEKMTGVNRLLILAEVDGGLERHHNIRKILEKLKLHLLPGLVLVGDLCITNVYTGISKHGGKYACYVCEGECTLKCGKLRTFASLNSHYRNYEAAGANPKKMQKYKNVINECLLEAHPEEKVGDVLPLPELHLVIGVGTHFYKLLKKVWPPLTLWGRGKWTIHGRFGGALDGANVNRCFWCLFGIIGS